MANYQVDIEAEWTVRDVGKMDDAVEIAVSEAEKQLAARGLQTVEINIAQRECPDCDETSDAEFRAAGSGGVPLIFGMKVLNAESNEQAARIAQNELDSALSDVSLEVVTTTHVSGSEPVESESLDDSDATFEGRYRVVGIGDEGRRMALYDLDRDDNVWVNCTGYDDPEINDELGNLKTGNVIDAIVTHERTENEYWDLLQLDIIEDNRLIYMTTDGYAPGSTDELWEKRQPGNTYASGRRHESVTEDADKNQAETLYEVQTQQRELEAEDGETHVVFEDLQRGILVSEPYFEGASCDYLEDGADAIIFVAPEDKGYIVVYLFPEVGEEFERIWGELYHYIEG